MTKYKWTCEELIIHKTQNTSKVHSNKTIINIGGAVDESKVASGHQLAFVMLLCVCLQQAAWQMLNQNYARIQLSLICWTF